MKHTDGGSLLDINYKPLDWLNSEVEVLNLSTITVSGGLRDPVTYYWLEAEIGIRGIDWWYSYPWLRFKHEEDKVKFILRWL